MGGVGGLSPVWGECGQGAALLRPVGGPVAPAVTQPSAAVRGGPTLWSPKQFSFQRLGTAGSRPWGRVRTRPLDLCSG